MDKGTSLTWIPQSDCPLQLVVAKHASSDFLQSAILCNTSEQVVTGFRIGWIVAIASKRPKVRMGERVRLPEGVKPNDNCSVDPQAVRVDKQRTVPALAAFFVAEVFLKGAKPWEADLGEVERRVALASLAEN
jgi:hypothetical protein